MSLGFRDQPAQHGVKPHLYKEIQKIIQAWWHVPIVLATQEEAEVGESLESGRQRLQGAKMVSLHSNLGNSQTPSQKKKKKERMEMQPFLF